MTPHETHNALVRDFVMRFGRECQSYSELMVVLESVLLGGMQLNYKRFGLQAGAASAMVEAAVQRAIERFAESVGQDASKR